MSKTQEWFRAYSARLKASFDASAHLDHGPTMGSSREAQVLDVLSELLPLQLEVLRDGVIIDSHDTESPKFDALLVDRQYWPLLLQQDSIQVAMIESVWAAIEVKSHLRTQDLEDIFDKSARLGSMHCATTPHANRPFVVAFAYECDNPNLAFFDYALNYRRHPIDSPSVICALNVGMLFLGQSDAAAINPAFVPGTGLTPVLTLSERDSLLLFLYFLSRVAAKNHDAVETMLAYSRQVFSAASVNFFDDPFLDVIAHDEKSRQVARDCFKRTQAQPFDAVLRAAKEALKVM